VQALATKLDGIPDLGVPYPGLGCSISGVTAAGNNTSFPQLIGQTGTKNPPTRDIPAGSVGGTYGGTYTIPVSGIWRMSLHVRLDNQAGGKSVYAKSQVNGSDSSSWNMMWVSAPTAGSYPSATGVQDFVLNAGDIVSAKVAHDDATSRTITWRMMMDRIA
jgi:hypothetical protein